MDIFERIVKEEALATGEALLEAYRNVHAGRLSSTEYLNKLLLLETEAPLQPLAEALLRGIMNIMNIAGVQEAVLLSILHGERAPESDSSGVRQQIMDVLWRALTRED